MRKTHGQGSLFARNVTIQTFRARNKIMEMVFRTKRYYSNSKCKNTERVFVEIAQVLSKRPPFATLTSSARLEIHLELLYCIQMQKRKK